MARKRTTIYVEDALLRAAKIPAVRTGKKEYEVFEDALRGHLGLAPLQTVWNRNRLSEKDALETAYREIHASRRK